MEQDQNQQNNTSELKVKPIETQEKEIQEIQLSIVRDVPQEKKKIEFHLTKRKLLGIILVLIAFVSTLFFFIYWNSDATYKTITFNDGCIEEYTFNNKLKTPECSNARWLIEQSQKMNKPSLSYDNLNLSNLMKK